MERQRKPFSQSDYKNAQTAFSHFQRDVLAGETYKKRPYYPVLYREDFGIDAGVYIDEQAFRDGKPPLFLVELEVKTQGCCDWKPGNYPFPDVHFLYRKAALAFQPQVPFWVMYNGDGSDCCVINIEAVSSYPIAQNTSPSEDLIYMLPPEACVFGRRNLIPAIEQYFAEQANTERRYLWSQPKEVYGEVNAAYAARHRYHQVKAQHEKLILAQKKNIYPVGIKQYL